jgi:LPS O-antigen subunit length determinant protein (WzzB/FepE family)
MTNDYLREKAINESERNITYLTDQAAKTDVVGVRQAIYSILQNEINKVMLARGSDEYALKVVDPASPPERPSSPRPLLWTAAGCLGGALLAMIIAITRPLPAARPRLPQAVEAASS